MRDEGYQTKEVTTKPKTKNPASRIPKELMRTAILESKEKSQAIANARDNDMGEQSPSEYASGKVASAEEWAARKTGRTVTRAGKTAAQTSYEKIKQRAAGKKEVEKEAEKETARGTGDTQTADPASREAPEQKSREVQIQNAQRQKAVSDAVKTKEQKIRAARETPRIQNGQEMSEGGSLSIKRQNQKSKGPKIPQGRMPSARNSRKASGSRKSHGNGWSRRPYSGVLLRPPLHL